MVRERAATDEFAAGGFAPPRLSAYEVSVTFTTDRLIPQADPARNAREFLGARRPLQLCGGARLHNSDWGNERPRSMLDLQSKEPQPSPPSALFR